MSGWGTTIGVGLMVESQQPREYFIVVMSATMEYGTNVPGLAPLMVVELLQPPRAMCINQELVS
eukprot:610906-Rhodomonas_salina.1